jgi:hypothetical protein
LSLDGDTKLGFENQRPTAKRLKVWKERMELIPAEDRLLTDFANLFAERWYRSVPFQSIPEKNFRNGYSFERTTRLSVEHNQSVWRLASASVTPEAGSR